MQNQIIQILQCIFGNTSSLPFIKTVYFHSYTIMCCFFSPFKESILNYIIDTHLLFQLSGQLVPWLCWLGLWYRPLMVDDRPLDTSSSLVLGSKYAAPQPGIAVLQGMIQEDVKGLQSDLLYQYLRCIAMLSELSLPTTNKKCLKGEQIKCKVFNVFIMNVKDIRESKLANWHIKRIFKEQEAHGPHCHMRNNRNDNISLMES